MKPSVLFIYRNQNLAEMFTRHFALNGYDVYQFYDEELMESKFSRFDKLINVFHRVALKDTSYIHQVAERNFLKYSARKLDQLKKTKEKFDFCFVIRGDLVPENILKYSRSVSGKMINYQLDGLSVSSKILDYKKYFDQIYVFDKKDIIDYPDHHLKAITNCFFEEDFEEKKTIDFSYIGVNTERRRHILENFSEQLQTINKNYRTQFFLKESAFKKEYSETIIFLEKALSYRECLLISSKSKVVIDLKRGEHDGLSLRFFEALYYKNKIITNNIAVKNYDFYDPQNILVTDFSDILFIKNFMELPYKDISENIVEKYNFKSWIKEILN